MIHTQTDTHETSKRAFCCKTAYRRALNLCFIAPTSNREPNKHRLDARFDTPHVWLSTQHGRHFTHRF
jgi:hypothetical protein